jgi:hypothetical protein
MNRIIQEKLTAFVALESYNILATVQLQVQDLVPSLFLVEVSITAPCVRDRQVAKEKLKHIYAFSPEI